MDFLIHGRLFTVAKIWLIQANYLQDLKEVISRNHGVHEYGVSEPSLKGQELAELLFGNRTPPPYILLIFSGDGHK